MLRSSDAQYPSLPSSLSQIVVVVVLVLVFPVVPAKLSPLASLPPFSSILVIRFGLDHQPTTRTTMTTRTIGKRKTGTKSTSGMLRRSRSKHAYRPGRLPVPSGMAVSAAFMTI
jgi:hypothetical protein